MERNPVHLQLQFLPYLYADPSDALAVSALPASAYAATLRQWSLPQLPLHQFEDSHIPSYTQIESWGASQAIHTWAIAHAQSYTMPSWNLIKEINAKSFSFIHSPRLPHAALLHNEEEARHWLLSFSGPKVLKTCYGLSGTGHLLIEPATPVQRILSWLTEEWKHARPVIAEPWVDRLLDFSTQWIITKENEIAYIGSTLCLNDARGKYIASQVGNESLLFGSHQHFLEDHKAVAHKLLMQLSALGYVGNVGCDAMLYQDVRGLALHPIVEINARKTMGYASLLFQRKHFPGKTLTFRFGTDSEGLLPSSLHLSNGKQLVFKRNLQIEIVN
jgi:hypothetical protein